jgi:hypothetical protein
MPASGRPWARTVAAMKAECEAAGEPCWLCRHPIDYTLSGRHPQAFTADHVTPTSQGGDALRRANLKPAHYPLLQQRTRQHLTRSVPDLKGVVNVSKTKPATEVGATPALCGTRDLRGDAPSLSGSKTIGPPALVPLGSEAECLT